MEELERLNADGLIIGVLTFLIIGFFHPVVVKAEYYWGTKSWVIFLVLGVGATLLSLCLEHILWSAIAGVFAFSSFWTIKEVFEQEERVRKGWFPRNPKRKYTDTDPLPIGQERAVSDGAVSAVCKSIEKNWDGEKAIVYTADILEAMEIDRSTVVFDRWPDILSVCERSGYEVRFHALGSGEAFRSYFEFKKRAK